MTKRMKLVARLTFLLLALAGAVAWAADQLIVVEREAAIRKDKRSYSPKVAAAKEGETVTLLVKEDPWLRVEYKGVQGWMNVSSVTSDAKVVLSGQAVSRGVQVTEQSAARRGFNPEVERQYRQDRPALAAAYKLVDRIEKEWVVPEERVIEFLKAGKLLDVAGGSEK